MSTVLDLVVPVLAGLFLLGALIFLLRGLASRRSVSTHDYGVARQEARKAMAVAFTRGIIMLMVGLILVGIFGLMSGSETIEVEPTLAATAVVPTPEPTASPTPPSTETPLQQTLPTPTDVLETPTPVLTSTPAPSQTPSADSAVVNSPNGLWLREAPGGSQELELIPDGTTLELLPATETVDDLEWRQVRTPSGNEGWVAVDFIVYQ